MYPVSEAFLQAVQGNTRKYYWTGKITTAGGVEYPFDQEDIVKGSGYITAQCSGNSEIELGAVYAAEMGISLFLDIDRYTLEDAEVELSYHLRLASGAYETVPMGIFEVSEANRTVHVLELKAYDRMLRFDRAFNGFETIGTAYGMIALCSTACGVELAQTQAEIEALPNGSELLSIYPENDIETYRDVLYFTAQVLGGFFCINRAGKLEFRQYGETPVMEILQKHRFSSSFSDFVTRYTAVSSTNLRTQTSEYYALEEDDGLTMNLGVNPLLQFGLEETRAELCRNILTALSAVNYVPFDSDTIGNPALDLGDVLTFSGGQADAQQITCVTSFTVKIGGRQSLKCVGKNPRLSQAKSKNDKNISGLLNQIEAGKIGIHTFTNASEYSIGETDVRIISIEFASKEENHAQFFGQVVVDVEAQAVEKFIQASGTIVIPFPSPGSGAAGNAGTEDGSSGMEAEAGDAEDGAAGEETTDISVDVSLPVTWTEDGKAVCYVTFELNNAEILLHHPVETWHSGKHILSLYYPIENIVPNITNTFNVYLRMVGGSGSVGIGDCIASISGQAMAAAAAWDGRIDIEETVAEDEGLLYESSDNLPVAYASNNVNSTANLARGSLNLTESMALSNGYKFVWEFTPNQGNGTIAAVALTSALGGQNGFGSLVGDASTFLQLKAADIGAIPDANKMVLFEAVEMDFENSLLYSITFENAGVRIRKLRIPVFSIGLNEKLDDSTYTVLDDEVLTPETFEFLGSYTKYGEFMDGQDGYWYGFSNEGNSSGDATMLWIKISKTDYSFTEGQWTLSNAKLMDVGNRENSTFAERVVKCCVRGGYLYVPAYDKTGIYKISLSNSTDVTLINFGFTSKWKPLCETGSCELYLTLIGDLIIGGDFQITAEDTVIQTQGSVRLNNAATPLFQYKNFLFGWGGSYGNEYRTAYLLTPYLASINNLTSAVVKTVDKTMKITYTLTEE